MDKAVDGIATDETKQPQYKQNNCDIPQHKQSSTNNGLTLKLGNWVKALTRRYRLIPLFSLYCQIKALNLTVAFIICTQPLS